MASCSWRSREGKGWPDLVPGVGRHNHTEAVAKGTTSKNILVSEKA